MFDYLHHYIRVAKDSPEYISWALACGMFKGAFPMPAFEVVARRVSRSEIGKAWCLKTSYKDPTWLSKDPTWLSKDLGSLSGWFCTTPFLQSLNGSAVGGGFPRLGGQEEVPLDVLLADGSLSDLCVSAGGFFSTRFLELIMLIGMGSPPSEGSSQTRWGCETFTTLYITLLLWFLMHLAG